MATGIGRMGVAFLFVLVILSAAPVYAQSQESPSPQDIASEVWVSRGSTTTHGYLTRLTRTDLTLLDEDHQEQTIPLESVTKIERSGDPIWNGFAIGASVGLAGGIGMAVELRGRTADKVALVLYGAGIYGLIGAGIDAMHVGKTTVYERPGRKQALTIAPSRDWRGAMVGWRVRF